MCSSGTTTTSTSANGRRRRRTRTRWSATATRSRCSTAAVLRPNVDVDDDLTVDVEGETVDTSTSTDSRPRIRRFRLGPISFGESIQIVAINGAVRRAPSRLDPLRVECTSASDGGPSRPRSDRASRGGSERSRLRLLRRDVPHADVDLGDHRLARASPCTSPRPSGRRPLMDPRASPWRASRRRRGRRSGPRGCRLRPRSPRRPRPRAVRRRRRPP